jgi:hypothetical protein
MIYDIKIKVILYNLTIIGVCKNFILKNYFYL